MSLPAEVGVTFTRELRRNLGSAKGLVSSILFLLLGAATLWIYTGINNELNRAGQIPPAARFEMRRQLLALAYDDAATVDHLVHVSPLLLFLYNASLFFMPLLCVLIGYDQLAGDMQHRTIRYTAVRSRRESIVIGKMLGVWVAVAASGLVLHAIAWTMTITRGDSSVSDTLSFGLLFWSASALYAGVYTGLTMLISSAFRTPILALLNTFVTWFAWWLLRHIVELPNLRGFAGWLVYLTPGKWEPRMLSPDVLTVTTGGAALFALAIALTAGAAVVMKGRDV